jgi:hypothetical protein
MQNHSQYIRDFDIKEMIGHVSCCLIKIRRFLVLHLLSAVEEEMRDDLSRSKEMQKRITYLLALVPTNQVISMVVTDDAQSDASAVAVPAKHHRAVSLAQARDIRHNTYKDCTKQEHIIKTLHQWAQEGTILLRCACIECRMVNPLQGELPEEHRQHPCKIGWVQSFEAAEGRYAEYAAGFSQLVPYESKDPTKHIPDLLRKLGFASIRRCKTGESYPIGFKWSVEKADKRWNLKSRARPAGGGSDLLEGSMGGGGGGGCSLLEGSMGDGGDTCRAQSAIQPADGGSTLLAEMTSGLAPRNARKRPRTSDAAPSPIPASPVAAYLERQPAEPEADSLGTAAAAPAAASDAAYASIPGRLGSSAGAEWEPRSEEDHDSDDAEERGVMPLEEEEAAPSGACVQPLKDASTPMTLPEGAAEGPGRGGGGDRGEVLWEAPAGVCGQARGRCGAAVAAS